MERHVLLAMFVLLASSSLGLVSAEEPTTATVDFEAQANDWLRQYFEQQTAEIEAGGLSRDEVIDDWGSKREQYRAELLYMLGLEPLPERTPLHPVVTGTVERQDFRVENLHFQSRPGLYVTANLYLPHDTSKPCPTILYVCGHGGVRKNGVSYGNKVHYHHHAVWFARHGYVCLVIDSLQLGEIEGIHHGTYRYGHWWWVNRGYTPAGVEAWNCVRALDYLESRPEVDARRFGVTGRSGGGIYSWWLSAIDDRIRVAVPVAGITDMRNQVADGIIEGHCDCMFQINTRRWDFPMIAALVAPRPLLISNTDRDPIFPLDGVVRTHSKVRRLYRSFDAETELALNISEGLHKDTQALRINAFSWFNKHLRGTDELVRIPAEPSLEPEELQVFRSGLPSDSVNAQIHETFVPRAETPEVPTNAEQWLKQSKQWLRELERNTFCGWPKQTAPVQWVAESSFESADCRVERNRFQSQAPYWLPLIVVAPLDAATRRVELRISDDRQWQALEAALDAAEGNGSESEVEASKSWELLSAQVAHANTAIVFVAARNIGPTKVSASERQQTQTRRRFHLLGQTLDGMRVWDIRRAMQACRAKFGDIPLELSARDNLASMTLYASLFERPAAKLVLTDLPSVHRAGPYFLNVERHFGMPQAVALATSRNKVHLITEEQEASARIRQVGSYAARTMANLGIPSERLRVSTP